MNEYPSFERIVEIMLAAIAENKDLVSKLGYKTESFLSETAWRFDPKIKEAWDKQPEFATLHKLFEESEADKSEDADVFRRMVYLLQRVFGHRHIDYVEDVLYSFVDRGAIKNPETEYRFLRNFVSWQKSDLDKLLMQRIVNNPCADIHDFSYMAEFVREPEDFLNLVRRVEQKAKEEIKEEEAKEYPKLSILESIYDSAQRALVHIKQECKKFDKDESSAACKLASKLLDEVFNWDKVKKEKIDKRITEYEQTQTERILQLEKERDMYKRISELQSELLENVNNRARGRLINVRPDIQKMTEEYGK